MVNDKLNISWGSRLSKTDEYIHSVGHEGWWIRCCDGLVARQIAHLLRIRQLVVPIKAVEKDDSLATTKAVLVPTNPIKAIKAVVVPIVVPNKAVEKEILGLVDTLL